jgi:hypothetical protein
VKVITDYYDYNPKEAGIAPDVIGIKYNNKAIPFVQFDNHWIQIEGKPQIEVKTFKKNQYMVSLRNQGYDKKYLVMAETNFRVDYLVPIINETLFSNDIFIDLHMDDKIFIIANDKGLIAQPHKIELADKTLGTVKLLVVTTAEDFMKKATKCEGRVSIEYIKSIEENNGTRIPSEPIANLSEYCDKNANGLYYFNTNWYERVENGITYKDGKKVRTTGFYLTSPKDLDILKINKKNFYIKAKKDCEWQNEKLIKDHIYKVSFDVLDRSSNDGEEYFLSKNDINRLYDSMSNLSGDLKRAVKEQ